MYNREDIRQKIREYRGKFYSHQQIMEVLKLKVADYWYHWGKIKQENKAVYDKLTEENIREDMERTIQGLEQKIQELQVIVIDSTTEKADKIKAIGMQAELMAAIPRMRQEGSAFIGSLESGDTDSRQQKENIANVSSQ